jgi:hypothetical protein
MKSASAAESVGAFLVDVPVIPILKYIPDSESRFVPSAGFQEKGIWRKLQEYKQ